MHRLTLCVAQGSKRCGLVAWIGGWFSPPWFLVGLCSLVSFCLPQWLVTRMCLMARRHRPTCGDVCPAVGEYVWFTHALLVLGESIRPKTCDQSTIVKTREVWVESRRRCIPFFVWFLSSLCDSVCPSTMKYRGTPAHKAKVRVTNENILEQDWDNKSAGCKEGRQFQPQTGGPPVQENQSSEQGKAAKSKAKTIRCNGPTKSDK